MWKVFSCAQVSGQEQCEQEETLLLQTFDHQHTDCHLSPLEGGGERERREGKRKREKEREREKDRTRKLPHNTKEWDS